MMKKAYVPILLLILIFSTACSGGEGPREVSAVTSPAKSTDYLSLMPEETNILFYANIKSIKQTSFGEELSARFEDEIRVKRDDREYRDFLEATGVNPEKDIYELWFGSTGGDRRDNVGGAIVRGKFDEKKIVEYIEEERYHRLRQNTYRGHKIYTLEDSYRSRNDGSEFTFLNSETVAIGDGEWLKNVIDLSKDGGKNVLSNKAMARFIDEVPSKDQLWAVINLNEMTDGWTQKIREQGSTFKGTKSIENMQSLIFHTRVDKDAKLFIKGDFGTAEEAELLAETLNGFKAMAKLMVLDDKEAIDMLNGIKIKSDGSMIHINTTVDKNFFDKVDEKRKKFGGGPVKLL